MGGPQTKPLSDSIKLLNVSIISPLPFAGGLSFRCLVPRCRAKGNGKFRLKRSEQWRARAKASMGAGNLKNGTRFHHV